MHSFRLVAAATLTLVCNLPARGANTVAADAAARKSFQEAYAHATANLEESGTDTGTADSESLKNYPLYPYLQAARIQAALTSTDATALAQADKRAGDFIAAYGQQPVTRNLRHAWLDSLARREQWNAFMAAWRDAGASEASRCESFSARIELQKTEGLAPEIAKAWLTPHSLPECDRPFAWLKDNGGLTPALIEERVHLALDNNNAAFARQIIEQLPPDRAAPLFQWAGLLESPLRSIDSLIASPGTAVNPNALLAGWKRLARVDRDAAQERYSKLVAARGLNAESASPFALALGLALAWDRDTASLQYFDLVASADLDDPSREWWARAALWAKDWKLAAHVIASMSETDRQSARWRYWLARATEQTQSQHEAQPQYESVLPDDNYYSAMAAAHLGRTVSPHPEAVPADKQALAALEHTPAFERAHDLLLCGMRPEAQAEWQYGYEPLTPEARIQSIRMAAGWGWYDQAVTVATSLHVFNDYTLLYPRPYDAQVNAAAHLAQITPEIVYGVVRQESLYRPDAVSNAGARGLMQLQPATARSTAHFYKRPTPALTDLFDPYINTALGAARLRMLLDEFDGQIPVALAGYNAGPNAVIRWLPPGPIDSDIWIENIPYNETRGYVQRILWHSLMFTWLRTPGQALHTNTWLKPILPMHHTEQSDRVAASDRLSTGPKGSSPTARQR